MIKKIINENSFCKKIITNYTQIILKYFFSVLVVCLDDTFVLFLFLLLS